MNFRPIIFILIVSAALAVGWFYYKGQKNAKPAATTNTTQTQKNQNISNLTNISPADFDAITKKTYADANQKALEANSINKLAAIEVRLDKELSPDTFITRYIFNAADDPDNNWVMTVSGKGDDYVRALIPVNDYMGSLTPMNTKAWKYNFVTALQLAEKNGGMEWRENNTLKGMKLTLKHSGKKNWLLWIVEYEGENDNLIVKLDANSGLLVRE